MSNTPSDAELSAFADAFDWDGWIAPALAKRAFARAVLAKWGTPQPVVRESLTPERIEEICADLRNTVGCSNTTLARAIERAHGITQNGGSNADT